jgi:hypothetical protein
MRIPDFTVSSFKGLNTFIKDTKTLKPGIATVNKNWVTAKFGDHIELRRGSALLGQTRETGAGKVTGIGVGFDYSGDEVAFFSHGRKVKYYNDTDDDTVEIFGTSGTELTTNGSFTGNADGWTITGSGVGFAYSANAIAYTPTTWAALAQDISAEDNTWYRVYIDFGVTTGALSLNIGTGPDGFGSFSGTSISGTGLQSTLINSGTGGDGKLYIYSNSVSGFTLDNVSVETTQLLPAAADGEDVWFSTYQGLAGSFMYLGFSNSGIYKIPVANPDSARDQAVNNFRFGFLRFNQGRAFAGQRNGTVAGNADKTGVYLSDIDHALLSSFAQITAEALGGSGSTAYSGTLAASATTARTVAYVAIKEAGGETLTDDRNGNLVGDQGSTGTINYATGEYSVTFNHVTAGAVTADYYWELATTDGPLDFDTSSSGAGKAKIFRQDDGGGLLMSILSFLDINYCFHALKTWALTTTLDDTGATNLPYRSIGIPHPRAAKETPDGILLVDTSNANEPKVRRLEIGQNTNNLTIVPTAISDALDLSGYDFSNAVAFRWGDYEIVCCGEYVNGVSNGYNSVMFVRNVVSGAWDKLDYRVNCLAILDGALIGGDAISNNAYTLFSGFDDDEGTIDNEWQDGQLNLGTDNLKVAHLMRVTGLIQKDQNIEVYNILDDGSAVLVFTIEGDGSYVDQGINTTIGSTTIGSKVIGGGGEEVAHPFDVTFPIHTDRFQYISTMFKATSIGHAAINSYEYRDIRDKGRRSLPVKTV